MSEHPHTTGPWKVREANCGLLSSSFIVDSRGDVIASITGPFRFNRDAQLIAAAPEMLEALEIVFDVIEGAEGPTRTLSGKLIRWENIVETVQNAIAKANYEGRRQS